jgi:hypothetical protein
MKITEHLSDKYVPGPLFSDTVRSKHGHESNIWSPVGVHKTHKSQILQILN